MENKYPFKECNDCTLESIGACTIAGDLLSCSNPEVNKMRYPSIGNAATVIVYYTSGCKTCREYNICALRVQSTAEPSCCQNLKPIENTLYPMKTNGLQIHTCPCCGHRYWD